MSIKPKHDEPEAINYVGSMYEPLSIVGRIIAHALDRADDDRIALKEFRNLSGVVGWLPNPRGKDKFGFMVVSKEMTREGPKIRTLLTIDSEDREYIIDAAFEFIELHGCMLRVVNYDQKIKDYSSYTFE